MSPAVQADGLSIPFRASECVCVSKRSKASKDICKAKFMFTKYQFCLCPFSEIRSGGFGERVSWVLTNVFKGFSKIPAGLIYS